MADLKEAHFCSPIDFGGWHITIDGSETLCGRYMVEDHHISGSVKGESEEDGDCSECWDIFREEG